jgi:hypothetical protein
MRCIFNKYLVPKNSVPNSFRMNTYEKRAGGAASHLAILLHASPCEE